VKIVICNAQHRFATDADFSGTDVMKQPIFGCEVYINDKLFLKSSFGLPFIRFHQGSSPKITYENKTQFTFNIHYHGLNTVGSVDGTSMEVVFGPSTLLGPKVTFQFPEITNNQSLLWFHSHNMFVSMELIYAGLVGLLQITDDKTKWLTERFEYGNNQILLTALDMDLTSKGVQTFENLVTDENRSSVAVVNGTSAVNWYSSEPVAPFVDNLYHTTTKNLVKIDILNASLNWRVFHMGVCDKNKNIKSFHLVQVDGGLMNPTKLEMVFVPVAGRVAIIVDLDEFSDNIAYLFFYDYDLTEVVDSVPTFPDQPMNTSITATIPDFGKSNATPYPTPIPDPNQQNQQDDYTNLNYPEVSLIAQTNQILESGSIKVPSEKRIKPFLKIVMEKCKNNKQNKQNKLCLDDTIKQIRKTVFGKDTYREWKKILKQPDFEYDNKFNYLSFLNQKYYYNIPKIDVNNPTRNIFLFPETDTNAHTEDNINGTTEYVDGANRIMCDLWNSKELNLDWALQQYINAPNDYKPPNLPTSKFRIYKTNDEFSNTAMISNDTLKIQIFTNEISYGDLSQPPLATATVVFPPTPSCQLLNIQEWIDLVNKTFEQTTININNVPVPISSILTCDWSFFPYALDFLYQKTAYIKSAVIKTNNTSKYYIRFLGRWPLLQFFGKPLTGSTLDSSSDLVSQLRAKQQNTHTKIRNMYNKTLCSKEQQKQQKQQKQQQIQNNSNQKPKLSPKKNASAYMKCDEVSIYGIYDAEIQQIFPFFATSDGDVQLPIACMRRDAELIISPNETYIGLYDGYLNDNLNSFSVNRGSSEIWLYTNGDNADAHPIHFHLTSGFTSPQSNYNSPGLISYDHSYDPLIYSRDIYQVGPQETVSFNLTWPNYSSVDATKKPPIRCIGGVIHCHFLQHNDANSMIIQYFVNNESDESSEQCDNENNKNNDNDTQITTNQASICNCKN
jgi:FtsP/CotA-like multicopper oxidase with cupredoxin domain